MQPPPYGNPVKTLLAEGRKLGEENAICSVPHKAGSKAKVTTFVHASFILDQKVGFGVFEEA